MTLIINSIADLINGPATERPNDAALIFGERTTSFAALTECSNRIANAFLAENLKPGDRVAILGKNSDHYLAILLGAAKARLCTVTVNWRLAPAEISYILKHSGARLLIIEQEFADTHGSAIAQADELEKTLVLDPHAPGSPAELWWESARSERPELHVTPDDDFVQMYTSGTTGLPKGVVLTHACYIAALEQWRPFAWTQYDDTDVVYPPSPFFHVSGLNIALRSMEAGACTLLRPMFVPLEVPDLIRRYRITRTLMVPTVIGQLVNLPDIGDIDFSCLKAVTYGGSPIPPAVLAKAQEIFKCDIAQGYGLTECTGQATYLSPDDHRVGGDRLASCGRALPGTDLRIVDEDGQDLPPGEIGEILIQSPCMMKGYWRNPEATAATVVWGWLYTGDAGLLDEDGYLYIKDRVKDMIVSGGENIYPTEVENALSPHPAVLEVAVIGVPDERWGEAVKALIVLREGMSATPEEILAFARERIAGYKLPKSIDIVTEPLPRNSAGKVLRRVLREPFWADRDRRVD